jgi:hypothetical protein
MRGGTHPALPDQVIQKRPSLRRPELSRVATMKVRKPPRPKDVRLSRARTVVAPNEFAFDDVA